MKTIIKEFIEPTNEEKKRLWKQATVVFDTNVYLNLYRCSSKTRDTLLSFMDQMSDRIWMPGHVAQEFMKRRPEIIFGSVDRYEKLENNAEKFVSNCKELLRLQQGDEALKELQEYLLRWIGENKDKNLIVMNPSSDSILDKLLSLYDGKVGKPFNKEELDTIEKEAEERWSKKIPPGYKDANKEGNNYGDFIIWKEILKYSQCYKKDIVFITEDRKEDWWNKCEGRIIGPRIELRDEFYEITKCGFHMYNINSFIDIVEKETGTQVEQGVKNEVNDLFTQIAESISNRIIEGLFSDLDLMPEEKLFIEHDIKHLQMKNDRGRVALKRINKKYEGKRLPDDVEAIVRNTKANLYRDEEIIDKLERRLDIE